MNGNKRAKLDKYTCYSLILKKLIIQSVKVRRYNETIGYRTGTMRLSSR